MRTPSLLGLALLLAWAGPAGAETRVADSLEWMTIDARLIVRGKVISHKDTREAGASVIYRDITIEVAELLKGKPPPKHLVVRLRLFEGDQTGIGWNKSGRPYLFFLCPGRAEDDRQLAGKIVLRSREHSVIDLKAPKRVFTASMDVAKDPEAILTTVRKYAARRALPQVGEPNYFKPRRGHLRTDMPFGKPAHRHLSGGSAVYFNVPIEEAHWPMIMAKRRARSLWSRYEAANLLCGMPGKGAVAVLRELLHDPAAVEQFDAAGDLTGIEYPVRRAAYEGLLALGEKAARPLIERRATPEEVRAARRAKNPQP